MSSLALGPSICNHLLSIKILHPKKMQPTHFLFPGLPPPPDLFDLWGTGTQKHPFQSKESKNTRWSEYPLELVQELRRLAAEMGQIFKKWRSRSKVWSAAIAAEEESSAAYSYIKSRGISVPMFQMFPIHVANISFCYKIGKAKKSEYSCVLGSVFLFKNAQLNCSTRIVGKVNLQ